MVKLKENEIKFIRDNFDNAEELLQANHVNDILDPLDALIVYQGFDENYSLTDWGYQAQEIYDSIYYNNEY